MSEKENNREAMAKEYDAVHNRLFVIEIIVLIALLAVFQFTGASAALAAGLEARFGAGLWFVTNAVYTAVAVFGFSAFMLPLTYYSGYVLEHHYELSNETFGEWLGDFVKSLFIDILLASVLFSVIYGLLRWIPEWWWLAAAVFYILFSVVISTLAPVLIMPLFHKFEPLEEGELTDAVRKMMDEAGIKVVGVFKWGLEEKTTTANAAFAGFGRTKRIILGDTLLSGYSKEEILAILAHEVGHYKNKDTWRLMATASVLALLGFFVANFCLIQLTGLLNLGAIYDIAAAPVFIFCLFVFSLISMPFSNMHSRRREFAADAYAVATMGSADPLVSALEKLADQNLSNKEPAAWIEFLLHSHPSMVRRIDRARNG
ncbi:M48 family metallopeptidase [Pontiella agarivorans]|uniref:M48 family metallopeptidase n=1 Tax=Pontiella agarivorans TaxID=3038953 RepID=A0ABU5MZG3_9BACT|nr:M48 family metallopeptidase [Pontiella agarivorans]MDZ8119553.1 M48 family metallopeptidase [Pontiella agarivorans]